MLDCEHIFNYICHLSTVLTVLIGQAVHQYLHSYFCYVATDLSLPILTALNVTDSNNSWSGRGMYGSRIRIRVKVMQSIAGENPKRISRVNYILLNLLPFITLPLSYTKPIPIGSISSFTCPHSTDPWLLVLLLKQS